MIKLSPSETQKERLSKLTKAQKIEALQALRLSTPEILDWLIEVHEEAIERIDDKLSMNIRVVKFFRLLVSDLRELRFTNFPKEGSRRVS
jgi:hypothetical protein